MSNRAWVSERVRVRGPQLDDLPAFVDHAARHADEARLYGDHVGLPPSEQRLQAWLEREVRNESTAERMLVIENRDPLPVGTLNTFRADTRRGVFSYSVAIFPEFQRMGFGREAVILLLRGYFDELRFHKVQASVHDYNEASIAFHRRLGFVEEGRLREAAYTRGQRGDDLIFGMTADEFRARYPTREEPR